MFNSINLQKLRNAEFLQFMRNVHAISHGFELPTMVGLLNKLDTQTNSFEVIFKSSLKNPFTAKITKWDGSRDRTLQAIVYIAEGNRLHFDHSIAEKASTLLQVIRNHGTQITALNHQEETAVLNSLITEIETSESLSASITLLHLGPFLDYLKSSNAQCAELLMQRTQSKADNTSLPSKEQRQIISNAYSKLIRTIDAHIILKSDGDYQNLKDRLNELINEFKTTLKLRE